MARTKRPFLSRPYPARVLLLAVAGTQTVAAMIVRFGWLVTALPWAYVGLVWAYCLVWVFIEDRIKLLVYRRLESGQESHQGYVSRAEESLRHNIG